MNQLAYMLVFSVLSHWYLISNGSCKNKDMGKEEGKYLQKSDSVFLFCFVCLHLVSPELSVSLDCLYMIVSSVFSNVYVV